MKAAMAMGNKFMMIPVSIFLFPPNQPVGCHLDENLRQAAAYAGI